MLRALPRLFPARPARRWLAPRAAGVEVLTLRFPDADLPLLCGVPADLLPGSSNGVTALPLLRHLTIQWQGVAALRFGGGPELPALDTLWLLSTQLAVVSSNTDSAVFSPQGLHFGMHHGSVTPALLDSASWLPPCTTQLRLHDVRLGRLPGLLRYLPRLRRQARVSLLEFWGCCA